MKPDGQVYPDVRLSIFHNAGGDISTTPQRAHTPNHVIDQRPLVYIIDADQAVQQDLKILLESVNLGSEAFGSVRDFLARTRLPDAPSCLVLDVRLPGVSGLDFQENIVRSGPAIPVIFLSGHADIPMTVRAMKSGAIDFLTKPFREQDVLDAVAAALDCDRIRRRALETWAGIWHRFSQLTEREREVMFRVAAGRLNKQIAGDLGMSEPTVKIHRGSVMRKLSVRTVPDLVRTADTIVTHLRLEKTHSLESVPLSALSFGLGSLAALRSATTAPAALSN